MPITEQFRQFSAAQTKSSQESEIKAFCNNDDFTIIKDLENMIIECIKEYNHYKTTNVIVNFIKQIGKKLDKNGLTFNE
ncbi:MAG: hypothetical protein ACQBVK_02285 [Candidatus Phytoplasma sp. TWB_XP]